MVKYPQQNPRLGKSMSPALAVGVSEPLAPLGMNLAEVNAPSRSSVLGGALAHMTSNSSSLLGKPLCSRLNEDSTNSLSKA